MTVEELAMFRKRSEFPDDVFYISDFVTAEGVCLPEPPAKARPGPRAEKLQKYVASHLTPKEVLDLEKKPLSIPPDVPDPVPVVQTFRMDAKKVLFMKVCVEVSKNDKDGPGFRTKRNCNAFQASDSEECEARVRIQSLEPQTNLMFCQNGDRLGR